MATRIESGQMQLRTPGAVPMAQAQMPAVQPIGFQVAAQEQGRMAQMIQRMSESLFERAGKMAQEEGIRFAAENPLTAEEIELAKNGAITKPTGRIFDDAFRKARSLQLAAHFETEGMTAMSRMLPDIEAGRLNSEQVILKLREMNSGLTASLAKLDPDAALKFNASMAASGNTIVRKALDTEVKNARERDRIKIDMYFNDVARVLQETIDQNPEQSSQLIAMHEQNVNRAALVLGDATMQREYAAKIRKESVDAQVAVLSRRLMTSDVAMANPLQVIDGLRDGVFLPDQRFNGVLQSMAAQDPKAREEVIRAFRGEISARYAQREQDLAIDKRNREQQASSLIAEYYRPDTMTSRKNVIADELVGLRVLSIEQTERILNPNQAPGDGVTFTALQVRIDTGELTGWESILKESTRAGMNGEQINKLYNRSQDAQSAQSREALRFIRQASGVPDVSSVFASKQQEAQLIKYQLIEQRYQDLIADFREENPNQAVPFRVLSQQAILAYNESERADLQKAKFRKDLDGQVADLKKAKTIPDALVIDESTNLDDLVERYPRLKNSIGELERLQRLIRGTQR